MKIFKPFSLLSTIHLNPIFPISVDKIWVIALHDILGNESSQIQYEEPMDPPNLCISFDGSGHQMAEIINKSIPTMEDSAISFSNTQVSESIRDVVLDAIFCSSKTQ